MYLCVLGRQPNLGIAELEAMFGSDTVYPFGKNCAIVKESKRALKQENLGGTVKIAEVIATLRKRTTLTTDRELMETMEKHILSKPGHTEHKINVGISTHGINTNEKTICRVLFKFKDRLAKKKVTARVVAPKGTTLNSAQISHNKLTGQYGTEFIIASNEDKTYVARTISVQDIDSYSKRDYDRPGRDPLVGMLPPKLAQIMLNLAEVKNGSLILDPFCGTGVVLMEAALMHARIMGSDINSKMVKITRENLDWLSQEYDINAAPVYLERADATGKKWNPMPNKVVSETYLGPPKQHLKTEEDIEKAVDICNSIVERFLVNLRPQLRRDSICCIAVPMWNTQKGLVQLPVIEKLTGLGYSRVKFSHVKNEYLVYRRPEQIVARQLLVLVPSNSKNQERK